MVVFNMSFTAPINQQGRPTLTASQAWNCVAFKVRHAEKFVPAIVKTEILSQSSTEVKRRVKFAPGGHPAGNQYAEETCRLYEPCRVDFVSADGSVITNAISAGSGRDGEDLYYTYIFEWRHPEIMEDTAEADAQREADWKTTRLAVSATIDAMHRLVAEGSIL
ncbi:hypothetical protein FQN49_000875 [Arthroderma sp. PD_2]|nr:hypothetical protein FQN49_000875 [Arthroderma sp. PD_2]